MSYATKPKTDCNFFLKFQAPNTIPTYFHSFQTTTTLQSILLLSTIYQRLFILLFPRRLWEQVFSRFELKIMFGKERAKMIQFRPFKKKEGGSPLGGQWREKEKVLKLGGWWKEKEKVLKLGGQWKEKEKVLKLGDQWKEKDKVLLLGGQWKEKEKVP